jgi:hypothetical protein
MGVDVLEDADRSGLSSSSIVGVRIWGGVGGACVQADNINTTKIRRNLLPRCFNIRIIVTFGDEKNPVRDSANDKSVFARCLINYACPDSP